jgi:regulation of enolase protein 1 (concanavalin A-like superfamily)
MEKSKSIKYLLTGIIVFTLLNYGYAQTTHYNFTYADRASLVADGWDFIALTSTGSSRNTEQTSGAVVSYDQAAHPGVLRIPVDVGDLWAQLNNTRNTLFRSLPAGWTSIRLKFASFAPTQDYQQAGLVAYQNDNNYVQIMRIHEGGNYITLARETGGSASNLNSVSTTATTNLYFRLDRNTTTGSITSYYSLNGSDWTEVGSVTQTISNPRLAIVVGASPGGYPNADIEWAEVITPDDGSLTAGTIGTAQTICYNTTPAALTQLTAPTGGTGSYTYQWQSSTDATTWSNITGATLAGYSPPVLTVSTYYRRTVSSGTYTPVNSSPVLITVSPLITLAQLHDNITIGNNTSTNFNVVITGGTAPYIVNYTRNGAAQSPVSNYTSGASISTGVLITGTYTYALTSVTGAGGCSAQSLGTSITVTVTSSNPVTDQLIANPRSLVFSGIQGQTISDLRSVFVCTSEGNSIDWTLSVNASWLTPAVTGGTTDGTFNVSVNTGGLTAGVYNGSITIVSSSSSANPVTIPVSLIINPNVPVKAAVWKNDKDAAMSVSVDDGYSSGYDALQTNAFQGTYFFIGITPPTYYTTFYNAGMELGSHTVNHPCAYVADDVMRTQEIEPNIAGICANTPQPCGYLISFAWPCGTTTLRRQTITSDYFLGARGYNKNQLEDATPSNFMDLKSYNSHEHTPYPPSDLKTVVDLAVAQKKWFNMVLHGSTNDDGAINYAATQNIWVTSIGNVIKYILQRDRFILTGYNASTDLITFNVSRLSIPSSSYKNFEAAFSTSDITTVRIDVDDTRTIESVSVSGTATPYQIENVDGNLVLLTNVRLEPSVNKSIEIRYVSDSTPRIYLSTSTLSFAATTGTNPADQSLTISSNIPESFNWTATADNSLPAWLTVTPASGSGNGTIAVQVNTASLTSGTYTKTITVASAGATNTPQVVNVNLTINATGTLHYDFTYSDRTNLLAAGWDFIAVTPSGGSRNTEQTSGAVVSYDQTAHPGVIRIPVDEGDLWRNLNNTRNSLFRDLPSGWTSVRLKISAFAPTQEYQQAGLVAYQDDDNYVQVTRIYEGSNRMTFVRETGGAASLVNTVVNASTANLHYRLDRDPSTEVITAYYSLNGTDWTQLGTVTQQLSNPRLAIVVGASPGGYPNADIAWAEIISDNSKSGGKNINSDVDLSGISDIEIPSVSKLYRNYPNPFTTFTWIEYYLAEDSHVILDVHNSFGQKTETIQNQFMRAGNYRFLWETGNYPPGLYFLSLKTKNFVDQIKIIKLR